jgi:hypothetical protein
LYSLLVLQVPINSIPQKGNSLQVPLQAVLTYSNKVLKIKQGDRVLRKISGVERLVFWTGFNGTRAFVGSAPVPAEEIFGGGTLLASTSVLPTFFL